MDEHQTPQRELSRPQSDCAMELRHLRYFVAVADELNITRAAETLRLAQPSLTRQMHNLEAELGVRLLNRVKKRISLTEEGKSFLVDARRLVALSRESVKLVQGMARGESSQLNLGYSYQSNVDFLPTALAALYQAAPHVSVNLFEMSPADQMVALNTRKIDVGFIGLRPSFTTNHTTELTWECVAQHVIMVAVPGNNPLARKKKVRLIDLEPFFFVSMSEATHPGSRAWLSGLCRDAGFTPRILQDVNFEAGRLMFVAEGLGVTLVREQIRRFPHSGVVFRPFVLPVKADYWIAWHRDGQSKALAQFVGIVKRQASGL